MILQIPWESGGFLLIILVGLILGVLHTVMPCEDKFLFCFYAFGVSRDWKQAFRIVNFYGAGLFLVNLIIGTFVTYLASVLTYPFDINESIWHSLSAIVLILSGILMLYQIRKKTYWPHSDQFQELTESISTLRAKKRTAFLLGIFAGIPPCIFTTALFFNSIFISSDYGWGNGVWQILFFSIGTWIGLYPLAFIGTMSGKISKKMKNSSIQKVQKKLQLKQQNYAFNEEKESEDISLDITKDDTDYLTYSRIEFFSAWSLVTIGIIFLILAILGIQIIPDQEHITWPFTGRDINLLWILTVSMIIFVVVFVFIILWWKNRKYIKELKENLINREIVK